MVDYTKCASDIIKTLGVKNIKRVTHCITRLRIEVVDYNRIKEVDINAINGVKGYFYSRGQCQIILGSGTTSKVYDEIIALLKDKSTDDTSTRQKTITNDKLEVIIRCDAGAVHCPCKGKVIPQVNINDETFSSGIFGKGVGILPERDSSRSCVLAPFHGYITNIAVGRHAIGLCSSRGMELLIHVGIDTIQMQGEGFVPLVQKGDEVQLGDPILYFDINRIEKAGLDTTIVVLLTNSEDYSSVKCFPNYYNDEGYKDRNKKMEKEVEQMKKYPGMRRCSFCNRTENMVNRLISGPEGIYICDECVYICVEILEEGREKEEEPQDTNKEKEQATSKKQDKKVQKDKGVLPIMDQIIDDFFDEKPETGRTTPNSPKLDQDSFDDLVDSIINSF